MTEQSETTPAVRTYVAAVRRARETPVKQARIIAEALFTLPTQAEVSDFAATIRRDRGVQDVTLIEAGPYAVDVLAGGHWVDGDAYTLTAEHVVELAGRGTDVRVNFPDVFQYGTAVFFTLNGIQHRLRTKSFGPSETYLSM